ncbi:hypothetical protein Tco_0187477, partial [Tanacetum coccineum]
EYRDDKKDVRKSG